ncbi:type IV pilus modification PilV family protein [Granulibacter bethesdensis]|uniref:type IV pilus modification PilV family protein n=1 Tax=Granulibacter bethesdensis TaxID=364410 RepID=UPI0003F1DB02|nr:type II secretion system protein [Granulibacter bethesdensis]AHJ65759.1 General secretion pathway protein I [Granulibacter bethesdensis CGDNIH4]
MSSRNVSTPGRDTRQENGFTLLETLIAFIILALALSEIFDGSLIGLRSARRAEEMRLALVMARNHLDETIHAAPATLARAHIWEGEDRNAMRWRVVVRPLMQAPRLQMPLWLSEITVSVWSSSVSSTDGMPPLVTLVTRQMAGVR